MKQFSIYSYIFLSFCILLLSPDNCVSQTAKEYLDLGRVKMENKEFATALEFFTKAIIQNPKNAIAYNCRGAAKMELGDYIGAILDYDKVIELDPQNASNYNNRAFAKFYLDKLSDAVLDWQKAGDLGDENAYRTIKNLYKIRKGMSLNEVKQYFIYHKKDLDPLEGIWLRHLKSKTYYKGQEVPEWHYSDAQIVIFKDADLYYCYYLGSTIEQDFKDLWIRNSASEGLYLYTFDGDKFFGCFSVDKSFRLTNNQFETNFQRDCFPTGMSDTMVEVYSANYEKLFPK